MVHSEHMQSCMKLKEALTQLSVSHDWLLGSNESLVTRARNEMTESFLGTDHTHMMWLDADIEFEPEHVAAIWDMQVDIGVGVYAMKKRDKDWYSAWVNGKLVSNLDQFKEPIEVDYAGTGFMMIRRQVLENMIKNVETYENEAGPVNAFYMTPVHDGIFESEDYYFCRKAREAGYKVMMDPSVRLRHWGRWAYGNESLRS